MTEAQVFTVSQINDFIKEILETTFGAPITIEAEISNWRPTSTGHIYFVLKDSTSQIKAVMFKGNTFHLSFRPKDGDKVRCTGTITVYKPQGNYQIIVNSMEQAGSGNILQMIEDRKKKLFAEGLFDESRKKKLPVYPSTVGVVTSPTGAVIRDILNVAKRRNPKINITVFPAIVQGEEAAQTIVNMIELANFYKLCDVLIVGRGGGSLEDLLPFSEESVVRAVAASEIPVISAIGHEIDYSLCDYAADVRAPTPSAAAELAIPELSEIYSLLSQYKSDIYQTMTQKVESKRLLIKAFSPETLEIRFRNIQQPLLSRFDDAKEKIYENLINKIKELHQIIERNMETLENASPKTILKRGYSMVRTKDGQIIRSNNQVTGGMEIEITPAEGQFSAKVL